MVSRIFQVSKFFFYDLLAVTISLAISGTDLLEVPIPYIRPIFQALISGNIPTKYGQKYGTSTVPPF